MNRSVDDYKGVMKSTMDKWYESNLESWKYRSQLMISDDNIQSYMKTYKSIQRDHNKTPNLDNPFVYDNDEYKAITIHKFGKCEPPTAKSPVRFDKSGGDYDGSFAANFDKSFFATQSNVVNSDEPRINLQSVKSKLSTSQATPATSKHNMHRSSRRGTSMGLSKVLIYQINFTVE